MFFYTTTDTGKSELVISAHRIFSELCSSICRVHCFIEWKLLQSVLAPFMHLADEHVSHQLPSNPRNANCFMGNCLKGDFSGVVFILICSWSTQDWPFYLHQTLILNASPRKMGVYRPSSFTLKSLFQSKGRLIQRIKWQCFSEQECIYCFTHTHLSTLQYRLFLHTRRTNIKNMHRDLLYTNGTCPLIS